MNKRKDPADAFGLSLMDVLSNALGGVILLVLIVAVTLKGNDVERRNLPDEGSQGETYTALEFKPSPVFRRDSIIMVQIRSNDGVLDIWTEPNDGAVEISRVGRGASTDWMLTIRDLNKFKSDIEVFGKSTSGGCDSIFAISSKGSAVIEHIPGDRVNWSGTDALIWLEPDGELRVNKCD